MAGILDDYDVDPVEESAFDYGDLKDLSDSVEMKSKIRLEDWIYPNKQTQTFQEFVTKALKND